MMKIEEKLRQLEITLPPVGPSVGAYVPVVQAGEFLFLSGQLPSHSGKVLITGKVGHEVELNHAQDAARLCVINALAAVKQHLGDLDRVERIVRMDVFVNSPSGFHDQAQVANGASQLLREVFGVEGEHARVAVGVCELPLNAVVELALIIQVKS